MKKGGHFVGHVAYGADDIRYTRSKDGKLGGFKKGAFRIAIANQLPVIPITVQGTWEVWPPDAKMFFPGRHRLG